jgi:hypothetical protein
VPAAILAFKRCSGDFDACKLHLAEAQELWGDDEGAKRTRATVRIANHRAPEYWWVRTQAQEPPEREEDRPAF